MSICPHCNEEIHDLVLTHNNKTLFFDCPLCSGTIANTLSKALEFLEFDLKNPLEYLKETQDEQEDSLVDNYIENEIDASIELKKGDL